MCSNTSSDPRTSSRLAWLLQLYARCANDRLHRSRGLTLMGPPKKGAKTGAAQKKQPNFECRTDKEIKTLISQWNQYAHPRAREFFPTEESLMTVLEQIAKGIHREDDPVLGDDTKCCPWYGDVTRDDKQAAIRMVRVFQIILSS